MKELIGFVFIVLWIAGVVLVKGFWLTLCAVFIPFYAWYVVIERVMQINGMI